jgi:hypothetical protein
MRGSDSRPGDRSTLCLETSHDGGDVIKNDLKRFKAKSR